MNPALAARLLQAVTSQAATSTPLISASSVHAARHWRHLAPALQRCLNSSPSAYYAQPQPAESAESGKRVPEADNAQQAGASTSEQDRDASSGSAGAGSGGASSSEDVKQDNSAGQETKGRGAQVDAAGMLRNLAREVRETLMPLDNIRSYTRKYKGPVAAASADGPYTGSSALAVVKQKQTSWQKAWSAVHDKLGHLPLFNRLAMFKVSETAAYQKGQALVEDLKEKYETSDHPAVHKVEEYKERVFSGSEASRGMNEIRMRDPNFDMNIFLRSIKLDAPVVTKAFLKHDMETLRDYCGAEIMQRLEGLCKAIQQQELQEDPTILSVSDVEVVEVRMMESDPFVICQFNCQQLKCIRDKFGNVVEGSPDTIHRVYYFWGLQQEKQGIVTASGELLPPRWVIKDMLWQSMLALV